MSDQQPAAGATPPAPKPKRATTGINAVEIAIEWTIFSSRWTLVPFYLGLIAAQLGYAAKFMQELYHALSHVWDLTDPEYLQFVLGLIDIVMISNLLTMVIIGGYATFVSRLDLDGHHDRPDWLNHVDPGTLKIKLAGALVGISGIHLLQAFTLLQSDKVPMANVLAQAAVHLVFVVTTLLLAWGDLILQRKVNAAHSDERADGVKPQHETSE